MPVVFGEVLKNVVFSAKKRPANIFRKATAELVNSGNYFFPKKFSLKSESSASMSEQIRFS